ncbi:DUF221-domain-containing protein [Coprinellus micaceus]|uniref:DUF221-domain-containing protein n=1 Tax=Coprinellus micaceus TaxID=71717 RepID=A0A4Y7SDK6_COPMI|nr:DUF221-domain-containing protein [Coprinellus micaceus]
MFEDEPGLPPGTPPMQKFEGPWFTTQLTLSASIGITSFLLFSYCRTRWPLLFAPRTKLKGFSPHEAHAHQAFFGWIMPTIRTSEFTVLQIVGLDAAVLLNFFKMSFYLFSVCSMFAITIIMPLNWKHNKDLYDDDDDWPGGEGDWPLLLSSRSTLNAGDTPTNHTKPPDWLDLISDANSYLSVHLVFTYLFTVLALYFTYKNYRRFIKSRQLFSLELVHSIPARTVLVTNLPRHLQGERTLAEYFENMGMAVESVTICRDVGSLKALLDLRTTALLALERAWTDYVGNPSTVEEYDPVNDAESGQSRLVVPHRPRPTIRTSWLKGKVDALEYLEEQFRRADEAVKERRRKGKFRAAGSAFVTFEKMSSAQIAVQVAHASNPYQLHTHPAPEPRDIVWANMVPSTNNIRARDVLVLALMGFLLFTWIFPISALASLLSYKEIQKVMPWLSKMIDSNEQVRAIVQNSLPSVAMITLNALLPFMLEALTYLQGYRARSWVEYSLLKKYFLFLLINVVFIFLLASTYWQLVRDLANSPAKVPEKLAQALQAGRARHFFLSYVILQGLGIMPLQLLNLGVIIPRAVSLIFFTRTPRDFAELNAPPMINYGVVYPQAILMFRRPALIVIFGAIYFGVAYVVYKYKLLFVFYKPYESQGQAWPITFIRLVWGVLIFLLFMIGIFGLRKSYILSSLLVPLLVGTGFWAWYVDASLRPLSQFVSLSSVFESNLNRRRYAQNDDTLYVAPEDERTDYSQPPMANWYSGVLNTGKRRYGHPALNGVLPEPWLPLKKGQSLVNQSHRDPNRAHAAEDGGDAVVLTLRKRHSRPFGGQRRGSSSRGPRARDSSATLTNANGNGLGLGEDDDHEGIVDPTANPWQDTGATSSGRRRGQPQRAVTEPLNYDHASGVIILPDEDGWLDEDDVDSDEGVNGLDQSMTESMMSLGEASTGTDGERPVGEGSPLNTGRQSRYGTYFHHPERRRQQIPGAFPR